MKKLTTLLLSALCVGASLLPTFVLAAEGNNSGVNFSFGNQFLLGSASPVDIAIAIINWTLAILALIALIIILWGGMTWVLSQGEEEKIVRAKTIIRNGIIGLVIVLASWGIVTYIINALLDFTNAGENSGQSGTPPVGGSGSGMELAIDHTNPTDLQEGVPLCYAVAVTFSDPLITDTVNADTFKTTISGGQAEGSSCSDGSQCASGVCAGTCSGGQLPGSFGFSEDKKAAVFYPESDYYPNTKYHVEISDGPSGVQGVDSKSQIQIYLPYDANHSKFDFTTGTDTDIIPPKVDVVNLTPYPGDEATDICLNPTIQTTFSESIDPASPRDTNVWLYNYTGADPADQLDVKDIDMNTLVVADDTIDTAPQEQLQPNSVYGLNLYSGQGGEKNTGAIADMCGNPLSGNFDDQMTGSPSDDFVEQTNAGLSQDFCYCNISLDSCRVPADGVSSTCTIGSDTCDLGSACTATTPNYVGYDYQWTWTTGTEPYCTPYIEEITQTGPYYSEDTGTTPYKTDDQDSDRVIIKGKYLYPFVDVIFTYDVLANSTNCFDQDFKMKLGCFINSQGNGQITLRTPAGSETGGVTVVNESGSDTSTAIQIKSPHISYTSPSSGPVGQYITIKGKQFGIDKGKVFFDGKEAEVACGDSGWTDTQIIAIVPADVGRTNPDVQIITADSNAPAPTKHSNTTMFNITTGEPGPGLCNLTPNCSDTGKDDIAAAGEHLGTDTGSVWFDGVTTTEGYLQGGVKDWADQSFTSVGAQSPVTELDTYDVVAEDSSTRQSNGLDFKISCTPPPGIYENYSCDLEKTVYLPNPRNNEKSACVNNDIYFAFNTNMNQTQVKNEVELYGCNSEDTFDESECTAAVNGSFVKSTLSTEYSGSTGTNYDAYTFNPDTNLQANRWYQVVIPNTITNTASVPLAETYTWHFRVRNDNTPCDADDLILQPGYQQVTSYNPTATCLLNYDVDGVSGNETTYQATPLTASCLLLDNTEGSYEWSIGLDAEVIKFSGSPDPKDPGNDQLSVTTGGYNTVCLQGDDADNTGQAQVTAQLKDVADDALVEVDYGYCETDSDCYTSNCQQTKCDQTSHHCTPDITGFAPNQASGADVGVGGCLTINGCYFGPDQVDKQMCTCTSQANPGQSCDLSLGSTTCLLSDHSTHCTLGEELCTLNDEDGDTKSDVCSSDYSTVQYVQYGGTPGVITGCTCTSKTDAKKTCLVSSGSSSCVIAGTEACTTASATYVEPNEGKVTFDPNKDTHIDSDYPDANNCPDVWSDHQIIVQVPEDGSIAAPADYGITVQSFYTDTDDNNLSGSYGKLVGDADDCSIGTDRTACLCAADPNVAKEKETTDLYGEGFDILKNDGGNTVTFAINDPDGKYSGKRTDPAATTIKQWTDTILTGVKVPDGATGNVEYGVQAESTNYQSNPIDFAVSCGMNGDCQSGCCSQGRCADAQVCNTCVDDTDCSYNSCNSKCNAGICEPYITSISPTSGAEGQPVTINGCHFGSYYSSASSPYSKVTIDTADGIEAPLACSVLEAWNNEHIIVTMPSGTFIDDKDTSANLMVTQVSTVVDDKGVTQLQAQTSNIDNSEFTKNNSCSEVSIPVLCLLDPGYGTIASPTTLSGDHFYPEKAGYCSCATDTLGICAVDEGQSSCSITSSTVYTIAPEVCSETTFSTADVHAVWDANLDVDGDGVGEGGCVYTDPNRSSITCNIAKNASSCPAETETCTLGNTYYVNADNITELCSIDSPSYDVKLNIDDDVDLEGGCAADSDDVAKCNIAVGEASCMAEFTCGASLDSYVQLSGSIDFTHDVQADIDWDQYVKDTTYVTSVPDSSETGDVVAKATTTDNIQCVSNGMEFAVSCNTCGDCAYAPNLNCDLTYNPDDPGDLTDSYFGACTTKTEGFCRAATSSCCNNTSCVYDDTTTEADGNYDGGTCAAQPILTVDSSTNPEPKADSICLNTELKLEFDQAVTTDVTFEKMYDADGVAIPGVVTDFTDYITLVNTADPAETNLIKTITVAEDGKTLVLQQSELLDYNATYKISIKTNNKVVTGTNHQGGVISVADGVAVSCTGTKDAGCEGGYLAYTFTTVSDEATFQAQCTPSNLVLEAVNQDFIEANYIFTAARQTEQFVATVYGSGDDETPKTDDDQPISRIAGAYNWTYDWEQIYATQDELENSSCGAGGIIAGTDGSCSCTVGTESCTMAAGQTSCTTTTGVACSTDADTGICDNTDSHWTSAFVEDQSRQMVTAGSKDNSDDVVSVKISADATSGDGWTGTIGPDDDSTKSFQVRFCSSTANLVTYSNPDYNFVWSYCRGDDATSEDYLPKFVEAFPPRQQADIDAEYQQNNQFIYEVVYKDEVAIQSVNDPTGNNNIIALRVYPNNLQTDDTSIKDSINPDLWYSLFATTSDGSSDATVDGYKAIKVNSTYYIAATNFDDSDTITPYIYVLAYSTDATAATSSVVEAIMEDFNFNNGSPSLQANCEAQKKLLVKDTARVNELGSMAYVLNQYHSQNGNYPTLEAGSYIAGLTTSIWPSWNATLGNALGQTLATDPINQFADATTNCPYNPPDLSDPDVNPSDSTKYSYYDQTGTCWDPVFKDYKGPAGSHVYQYIYNSTNSTYKFYANLEYTGSGNWAESISDPCSYWKDSYSKYGCNTFNYALDSSLTTSGYGSISQ